MSNKFMFNKLNPEIYFSTFKVLNIFTYKFSHKFLKCDFKPIKAKIIKLFYMKYL